VTRRRLYYVKYGITNSVMSIVGEGETKKKGVGALSYVRRPRWMAAL